MKARRRNIPRSSVGSLDHLNSLSSSLLCLKSVKTDEMRYLTSKTFELAFSNDQLKISESKETTVPYTSSCAFPVFGTIVVFVPVPHHTERTPRGSGSGRAHDNRTLWTLTTTNSRPFSCALFLAHARYAQRQWLSARARAPSAHVVRIRPAEDT